jgi:hypothetical protein
MGFFARVRGWLASHVVSGAASEAGETTMRASARARSQWVALTDWAGVWTVDAVGTAYFAERTDLADQIPIVDARERNVALYQASIRHPELAHLKPVRQAGDEPCPDCRGSGKVPEIENARGNFICTCGGTGWLPNGYVDPRRDRAI